MTNVTLADFLLARIAEVEDDADAFKERDYDGRPEPGTWWHWVLAECKAGRDLIEYTEALAACSEHSMERTEGCDECSLARQVELYDQQILGRLALPYADHPDYRAEWRP